MGEPVQVPEPPYFRIKLIEVLSETDRVWPESWEWEWVRNACERLADALIAAGVSDAPRPMSTDS